MLPRVNFKAALPTCQAASQGCFMHVHDINSHRTHRTHRTHCVHVMYIYHNSIMHLLISTNAVTFMSTVSEKNSPGRLPRQQMTLLSTAEDLDTEQSPNG